MPASGLRPALEQGRRPRARAGQCDDMLLLVHLRTYHTGFEMDNDRRCSLQCCCAREGRHGRFALPIILAAVLLDILKKTEQVHLVTATFFLDWLQNETQPLPCSQRFPEEAFFLEIFPWIVGYKLLNFPEYILQC